MKSPRTCIIGAGVGGLTAAIDLALTGHAVSVYERAAGPGGKMRRLRVDGVDVDAGPTVFTMRWIFEQLYADAGQALGDYLELRPASVLARHAWTTGGRLDLHADTEISAHAIEQFSGAADARGYRDFCARSADIFATLRDTFIAAQRPSPPGLVSRVGLRRLDAMWRTAPFKTLWGALGEHFTDPRLRQLFGRYATYVGSSPLQTPATLMLIAHVEQTGVWQVTGGLRALAGALQRLGEQLGVKYHFDTPVERILLRKGAAAGVELPSGERCAADAVVFNGDVSALASGLLGPGVAHAAPATPRIRRGLSAITWCIHGVAHGFPLHYHNVFFAGDYPGEFRAIFGERQVAGQPTVYVCAQDRIDGAAPRGRERLLVLINAPPDGDLQPFDREQVARLQSQAFAVLKACGLTIEHGPDACVTTTPRDFNGLFPGSGGSLYGRASHGMMASFARSGAGTRVRGLYLAGGTVHPGPGVPMAAMSGRLAARALCAAHGDRLLSPSTQA